jgi:hypothetical protein
MNKLKKKLLTKWFMEWVKTETDVETLQATTMFIRNRKVELVGEENPPIGFRRNNLEMSK